MSDMISGARTGDVRFDGAMKRREADTQVEKELDAMREKREAEQAESAKVAKQKELETQMAEQVKQVQTQAQQSAGGQ